MVQTVSLPNGDSASFPDSMSREEIQSVIQQHQGYQQQTDNQDNQDNQSTLSKIANSQPIESINAFGGGIQQGLASTIGTAIGKPEVSQALSPPSFVQDSMDRNPMTAMGGNVVGTVAPAAALIGATGGATAPLLGEGLVNAAAANTIAGSILAGPNNRTMGGAVGLATTAISPIIGSVGNYLDKSLSLSTKVKSVVGNMMSKLSGDPATLVAKSQANMYNVSEAVDNQLFNSFRQASGNIESNPITYQAAQFLNNNADELVPAQQKVIMNLIQNVSNSKTIAELHDARKIFAYDFGKFTEGKPLTADAAQEFKTLNSTVANVMSNNAENLGVGKEFQLANEHYQNTMLPLINTGAKDTADALSQSNIIKDPMAAAQITDTLANKYINLNKSEQTKAFLNTLDPVGRQAMEVHSISSALEKATSNTGTIDYSAFKTTLQDIQKSGSGILSENSNKIVNGMIKFIDEGTNIGGISLDLNKLSTGYKLAGITSALGAIAYHSGTSAAGLVGIAGLGALKLLQSQVGQNLLIKAGSEGGKSIAKQLVNGLIMQKILTTVQDPQNPTPVGGSNAN